MWFWGWGFRRVCWVEWGNIFLREKIGTNAFFLSLYLSIVLHVCLLYCLTHFAALSLYLYHFFLNENGPVKVDFLFETRDVNRLACVRS